MEELKKRYVEKFIPERYLERFARTDYPWVKFHLSKLYEVTKNGKLRGPRGLEIGFGPTLHRMAIMSMVCEEVVGCDYCPRNIDFITQWLRKGPPVSACNDSLKYVSKLEGHEDLSEGEATIFERVRAKVNHLVQCDITSPESVQNLLNYGGPFDCVVSNATIEVAVQSYKDFVQSLKLFCSIMKPGAALVLSGYLKGNFYMLDDVKFDGFYLESSTVRQGLEESGFRVEHLDVSNDAPAKEYSEYCDTASIFFSLSYKI